MRSVAATKLADAIAAAVKAAPPAPAAEEAIPEGSVVDALDKLIEGANRNGRSAEAEGNMKAYAQMVRLAKDLHDLKRKVMPLPAEDPNEHPDMIAAKERARAALHKLIDQAVGDA